jgi:hypothetical protein
VAVGGSGVGSADCAGSAVIELVPDRLAPFRAGGEYVGFVCSPDAFKVILRDPDGSHRALVIRRIDADTDWSFGVEDHEFVRPDWINDVLVRS